MGTRSSSIFWCCLVATLFVAVAATDSNFLRIIPNDTATARIVNGDKIYIDDAPYMVQLGTRRGPFCGGTLISPHLVLTAAHCVEPDKDITSPLTQVLVRAGISFSNEKGGSLRALKKIIIHPDRGSSPYKADIAILLLAKPFIEEDDTIEVLNSFCTERPPVGSMLQVNGWGAKVWAKPEYKFEKADFANQLRRMRTPIISEDECVKRLKQIGANMYKSAGLTSYKDLIYEANICTFHAKTAFCQSDSGGPGIYKDKLCAVVSWNYGCNFSVFPSIYTSIPEVLPFIKRIMKKYENYYS